MHWAIGFRVTINSKMGICFPVRSFDRTRLMNNDTHNGRTFGLSFNIYLPSTREWETQSLLVSDRQDEKLQRHTHAQCQIYRTKFQTAKRLISAFLFNVLLVYRKFCIWLLAVVFVVGALFGYILVLLCGIRTCNALSVSSPQIVIQ